MTEELETDAADLYGKLSAAIHGTEISMVHRGVVSGAWTGQVFKYDRFQRWCEFFSRCVDVAIRIQALTINEWWSTRLDNGIRCSICHATDNFHVYDNEIEETVVLTCNRCGEQMTYDRDWMLKNGLI